MDEPFLAEIRVAPTRFIPDGWAWCNGQELPISQYPALFEILGTTFGGDGQSNFALPDLRGRKPVQLETHLVKITSCNESGSLWRPKEGRLPAHNQQTAYFCIALQGVFPLSTEGN